MGHLPTPHRYLPSSPLPIGRLNASMVYLKEGLSIHFRGAFLNRSSPDRLSVIKLTISFTERPIIPIAFFPFNPSINVKVFFAVSALFLKSTSPIFSISSTCSPLEYLSRENKGERSSGWASSHISNSPL